MVGKQALPVTATDALKYPGDPRSPLVSRKRHRIVVQQQAAQRAHTTQLQVLNQERRSSFNELDKEKEAMRQTLQKLNRRRRSIDLKRRESQQEQTTNKRLSRNENPTITIEVTVTDSDSSQSSDELNNDEKTSRTIPCTTIKSPWVKLLQKRDSSGCHSDGEIETHRPRSSKRLGAKSRDPSPCSSEASSKTMPNISHIRPRSQTCPQIDIFKKKSPSHLTIDVPKLFHSKSSEDLSPTARTFHGQSLPDIHTPINEPLETPSVRPKSARSVLHNNLLKRGELSFSGESKRPSISNDFSKLHNSSSPWKRIGLVTKSLQSFTSSKSEEVTYVGPKEGTTQNTLPIYYNHKDTDRVPKPSMHTWLGLDSPKTLRKMQGKPEIAERQDSFEKLFNRNEMIFQLKTNE